MDILVSVRHPHIKHPEFDHTIVVLKCISSNRRNILKARLGRCNTSEMVLADRLGFLWAQI